VKCAAAFATIFGSSRETSSTSLAPLQLVLPGTAGYAVVPRELMLGRLQKMVSR
jgi:hypothetical protein